MNFEREQKNQLLDLLEIIKDTKSNIVKRFCADEAQEMISRDKLFFADAHTEDEVFEFIEELAGKIERRFGVSYAKAIDCVSDITRYYYGITVSIRK